MRYCAAYQCNNADRKRECASKSFFGFPLKNNDVLKQWLAKLKRDNFIPSKYSVLCSDHFNDECFLYQKFTNRRQLKPGSIPTIFSHLTQSVPRREIQRVVNVSAINSTQQAGASNHSPFNAPQLKTQETQTECTFTSLIDELCDVNVEKERLQILLQKQAFNCKNIETDSQMRALTGYTKERFQMIFEFLNLEEELISADKLSPHDKFFLFMVKLRTGISNEFLSVLFSISDSTVSRYFNFATAVIYQKLKVLDIWPSKTQVKKNMSLKFLECYHECRVIIDCTELKIQKPFNPAGQQLTFSYYKNANTVKAIVGLSPSGEISFISDLYCGSISDKEIFKRCGILMKLGVGDLIMADKGFKITNELKNIGCSLLTPCFLTDKIQFSWSDRVHNFKVSNLRVHVERAISRIKVFKYFDGLISYMSLHNLNEVFFIATMLTNFNDKLIKL